MAHSSHRIKNLLTHLSIVLFLIAFIISFDANGLGVGETVVVVCVYVLAFLAFLIHLICSPIQETTTKTNRFLVWFFLLYIIWLIMAPYTSTWFDMSRYSSWILLLTPISFFIATYLNPTKVQKIIGVVFYFCVGMVLFIWALLHFIVTRLRPDGPLLDANVFAGILLFFLLPPLIYYLVHKPKTQVQKKIHEYLVLYFLFGFPAFFTSYSRSAIGALIIVGLLLLIKIYRDYEKISLKKLIHILLIISISFITVFHFTTAISLTRDLKTDNSFSSRVMMWETNIDIYENNNKFTGIGFGQFKEFYMRDRNSNESSSSGDHAHNDYIQFLLEGGLIQFSFFVLLSFFIIFQYYKLLTSKSSTQDRERNLKCFLVLNLCCVFFIQATVNFAFIVVTNAILIGVLLGYFNKTALVGNFTFSLNKKNRALVTGLLTLGLSSMLLSYYTASIYYYIPTGIDQTEMDKLAVKANKLSTIQPRSLSLATYKIQHRLLQLSDAEVGEISSEDLKFISTELARLETNKKYDATIVSFYAKYALDHPDIFSSLSKNFPKYRYFKMSPEQLYLEAINYNPFSLHNYEAIREIYLEKDQLEKAYNLRKNKLYDRPDFHRINAYRRLYIYEELLNDAVELGLYDEARHYANIYIRSDKCNKNALMMLELELPEDCPNEE